MKTRNDFVSNSSSSSFIVIDNSGKYAVPEFNITYGIPFIIPSREHHAHTQFWWEEETFSDFWSKLNWRAICIIDAKDVENGEKFNEISREHFRRRLSDEGYSSQEMEALLKEVCSEIGLEIEIDYKIDDLLASIDHQSTIYEEPDNARMFKSKDALIDFLLFDSSYIQTDNDNH